MDKKIQKELDRLKALKIQNLSFEESLLVLKSDLDRYITNFTGEDYRDIDHVLMEKESEEMFENGAIFKGVSSSGITRMLAGVYTELPENDNPSIILIMTTHNKVATPDLLGKSGEYIGNKIHVARLLHIAINAFIKTGQNKIINDPYTPRLEYLYTKMGFTEGKVLELGNVQSLRKALHYINITYKRYGKSILLE